MVGGGGVIQENTVILFIRTQLLAKLTNYQIALSKCVNLRMDYRLLVLWGKCLVNT